MNTPDKTLRQIREERRANNAPFSPGFPSMTDADWEKLFRAQEEKHKRENERDFQAMANCIKQYPHLRSVYPYNMLPDRYL